MLTRPMINQIVRDEGLVRGLNDPEARVLIEWLVERAEEQAHGCSTDEAVATVRLLRRRGKAIGRFVALWCHSNSPGAAAQLAAAERFAWPLPSGEVDPCMLMQNILSWEEQGGE